MSAEQSERGLDVFERGDAPHPAVDMAMGALTANRDSLRQLAGIMPGQVPYVRSFLRQQIEIMTSWLNEDPRLADPNAAPISSTVEPGPYDGLDPNERGQLNVE